jgi:hypothetical protein
MSKKSAISFVIVSGIVIFFVGGILNPKLSVEKDVASYSFYEKDMYFNVLYKDAKVSCDNNNITYINDMGKCFGDVNELYIHTDVSDTNMDRSMEGLNTAENETFLGVSCRKITRSIKKHDLKYFGFFTKTITKMFTHTETIKCAK